MIFKISTEIHFNLFQKTYFQMTFKVMGTVIWTVLVVKVVAPIQSTISDESEKQSDIDGDCYWLEMTNNVLRWVVFPVAAYLAGACNYFIIFTVFDLGLDRACKVLMGFVAVTDFIQLLSII